MSLRELLWMAESRQKDNWNHTAAMMALIANCHRNPKKSKAFKPGHFHPYEQPKRKSAGEVHHGKGFARKCFLAFAT